MRRGTGPPYFLTLAYRLRVRFYLLPLIPRISGETYHFPYCIFSFLCLLCFHFPSLFNPFALLRKTGFRARYSASFLFFSPNRRPVLFALRARAFSFLNIYEFVRVSVRIFFSLVFRFLSRFRAFCRRRSRQFFDGGVNGVIYRTEWGVISSDECL